MANISPIQFLFGFTNANVVVLNGDFGDLFESFFGGTTVNLDSVTFGGVGSYEIYLFWRIFIHLLAWIMVLGMAFSSLNQEKRTKKMIERIRLKEQGLDAGYFSRIEYVERHYVNLKKGWAFVEGALTGAVLAANLMYACAFPLGLFFSSSGFTWNWIFSLFSFLVVFFLINGSIQKTICREDIRKIKQEGAVIEGLEEDLPTPTGNSEPSTERFTRIVYNSDAVTQPPKPAGPSESAREEEERIALLQKYKKLLDEGVITEEEFQAKKNDLLKH
ncbi:MAG: SHOCT domain-containing protein [Clostridia bacterium]|nr:SHOCT domain-containing protein [Clostridia bacterium]